MTERRAAISLSLRFWEHGVAMELYNVGGDGLVIDVRSWGWSFLAHVAWCRWLLVMVLERLARLNERLKFNKLTIQRAPSTFADRGSLQVPDRTFSCLASRLLTTVRQLGCSGTRQGAWRLPPSAQNLQGLVSIYPSPTITINQSRIQRRPILQHPTFVLVPLSQTVRLRVPATTLHIASLSFSSKWLLLPRSSPSRGGA